MDEITAQETINYWEREESGAHEKVDGKEDREQREVKGKERL